MNKKPVHTIRRGSLEAAIWENESKEGHRFWRATFARRYRDASGQLQNTSSFGALNLEDLVQLVLEAQAFIGEGLTMEAIPVARADAGGA